MNKQDASDLFDQSVKRYWDDLEEGDLSNDQRQIVVNDLLVAFLRVSTTVEKLGIFSPKNETIDDIKTLDLKFLLTSFYLSQLFSRIQAPPPSPSSGPDQMKTLHAIRKKNLGNAKTQIELFLNRCEQMQIMSLRDSEYWSRIEEGSDIQKDMAARRTEKIERLKRRNALDKQVEERREQRDAILRKLNLKSLEDMENSSEFEEAERSYQTSRINQAILQAIDDVSMYNEEMKMLDSFMQQDQHRPSGHADARVASMIMAGGSRAGGSSSTARKPQVIETNPAAIERQGGLRFNRDGAPTLIKLTPSDMPSTAQSMYPYAFRQQKLQEMFTERNPPTKSLAEYAEEEMRDLRLREASDQEAKKQREVPEHEQDRDEHVDRETYKAREWDDWKDANPRGMGRLPQ